MSFNNLQLIEPLLKALSNEGYTNPTAIQEKSIPSVLQGRDLLGCAQTGTGKTAAFVIPILQLMHHQQLSGVQDQQQLQTLILTPTRELAIQIGESIKAYGRFIKLRHAVIYGGVSQYAQVQTLRRGVDIVVATPGRLLDLIHQRIISLNNIRYFVLDEADRMLDMGFAPDVKRIIAKLPVKRQTLFFSATMPTEIRQLANMLLTNPVKVEVTPVSSTVDIIQQQVYFTEKHNKQSLLIHLLQDKKIETALVFTQMKHNADKLAKALSKSGIAADSIHGNKSQNARQNALQNFKNKKIRVLVATDIAARGIDIEELSHVINYELPNIPETYVHRIGRTGRAGAAGISISFCDWSEKTFLIEIQKLINKTISVVKEHPFDIVTMHTNSVTVNSSSAASSFGARRSGGMGKRYGRTFTQRA